MSNQDQNSIEREVSKILVETVVVCFVVVLVSIYGWDFDVPMRISYATGLLTVGLVIGVIRGVSTRTTVETATLAFFSFFVINYANLLTGYSVAFVSGSLLGATVFTITINISEKIACLQRDYGEEN